MKNGSVINLLVFPALILMIGGLISMIAALKYRTERHPGVPTFNPRHWFSYSKAREWYTPKGYKLAFWGGICTSAGAFLGLLLRLI